MNEIEENKNTYEERDSASELSSFSEIPAPGRISESTNDKTTMHRTKTYRDVLLGMK